MPDNIPERNDTENTSVLNIEALDLKWYSRFEELASFETEDELTGDKEYREEQKKAFLAGEIDHPVFDLPKLDIEEITDKEEGLLKLKKDILEQEQNELVKQVYRWRINEKIAALRLLKAAKSGNVRSFERYNYFIYGKPSEDIFAFTVESIRAKAKGVLENTESTPEQRAAAQDILDSYIEPKKKADIGLPTEETYQKAKEVTLAEVSDIIDMPEFEGEIGAEEIRRVFETVFDNLGISKAKGGNWEAIIDTSSAKAVSISPEQKAKIPESRTIEYKNLLALIAHEIGTHVARRVNGNRSRLMLLGMGLDRYISGEEGVATMREQVIKNDDVVEEFAGINYHLGISFAQGLDGTKRSFSGVHEMLTKRRYLERLLDGQDPDKALRLARVNAYNDCVRIFRGSDCETPGVVFSKDLAYREGNIGVYQLINTQEGQQEMLRFSVGKYDPSNQRHIWILDQLGITEADLDYLQTHE
ncbi:MAG TPA: DUF1704 domain-containing protein [Candidatus Saccharibacteria bacterium]|nr:DUF1704 domain-containing protein [Candidatus Saccharibacteria bacterium]HMT39689.1 DUF1704 domain-containing protein [Candidatus Saccharibacteria bacterium]